MRFGIVDPLGILNLNIWIAETSLQASDLQDVKQFQRRHFAIASQKLKPECAKVRIRLASITHAQPRRISSMPMAKPMK
jgi:hypothetical protein